MQQDGDKQQTIKTSLDCKTQPQIEKVKICHDWIRVSTAANIPLHKSDNPVLRRFLQSKVVNGGSIPKSSQLRDRYLFDVYEVERTELKNLIKGKNVALIADELSDEEGRYVLNIMVVLLGFDELSPHGNSVAYMLDSHFLSATNNKTVSQHIVKTVNYYEIDFDNVLVFNTDNISYMKKAFNDALSCLFPNCVHITCLSHIVNLVASDFKKKFKEVTEFVKCFRNIFFVPSARKSRFRNFLQSALGAESTVKMPPNPTTKSWKAWFDSALYHADHYFLLGNFISEELVLSRDSACNSLIRLGEIYNDQSFMKRLYAQLAFIKVKAPAVLMYLDYFQERMPHILAAHGKLESLLSYLRENSQLQEDDLYFCFPDDFSCNEKEELVCLANSAFTAALEKLDKYVNGGAQPAATFLNQIRVLDPRNLIDTCFTYDSIDSIPGFDSVTREEWRLYANIIGPNAVKNNKDVMDMVLFWKSKATELPNLYKIASTYYTATITSCDVERSFSSYNDILSEKRRSLDPATVKAFHFLNWNLRVKSTLEKEQEDQQLMQTASKPPVVSKATSTKSSNPQAETTKVFTNFAPKQPRASDTSLNSSKPKGAIANVFAKTVPKQPRASEIFQNSSSQKATTNVFTTTTRKQQGASNTCTKSTNPEKSLSKSANIFTKVASKPQKGSNAISVKTTSIQKATLPPELPLTPSKETTGVNTAFSSEPTLDSTAALPKSTSDIKTIWSISADTPTVFSIKTEDISVINKRKIENSDMPSKRKKEDKRILSRIHHGLQGRLTTLKERAPCHFPDYQIPLRNCLLNGSVNFKGDGIINDDDIKGLLGGNSSDEDNYLSNFIVDSYLKLLSVESSSVGLSTICLQWEQFEKNVGKECNTGVLKRIDKKASLLEHDYMLVPCMDQNSRHWFLLVAKPKDKQIFVLDSLAGNAIKPSAVRAISKMWCVIQDLNQNTNECEWSLFANKPTDIPQQQNGYDCGVYLCAYARNLLLQAPVPYQSSIPSFRSVMLLELHGKQLHDITNSSPQVGMYYAVGYDKSYYFGRVLENGDSFTSFKFLHSTGARSFDWPRRDDLDRCHDSHIFYGPVSIVGIRPFTIPQQVEVEEVYQWLKKDRKHV